MTTENTPQEYWERHEECYATSDKLKLNWSRDDRDKPAGRPGWRCFGDEFFWCSNYPQDRTRSLPIALLRTCRSIYDEAAMLPYATNTFAFHETDAIDLFFSRSLLAAQCSAIQNLQLDLLPQTSLYPTRSLGVINSDTIQKLSGLQRLRSTRRSLIEPGITAAFQQLRIPIVRVLPEAVVLLPELSETKWMAKARCRHFAVDKEEELKKFAFWRR